MNLIILLASIIAAGVIAYRTGRYLAISDLHRAAGQRLTRSEHKEMGQLMDKAYGADE